MRLDHSDDVVRRRIVISGRVQGVYFRASCRDQAVTLGVNGWVHNRQDGRVEAVFEGSLSAVDAMIEWCKVGPRGARVASVEIRDELVRLEAGFAVI